MVLQPCKIEIGAVDFCPFRFLVVVHDAAPFNWWVGSKCATSRLPVAGLRAEELTDDLIDNSCSSTVSVR